MGVIEGFEGWGGSGGAVEGAAKLKAPSVARRQASCVRLAFAKGGGPRWPSSPGGLMPPFGGIGPRPSKEGTEVEGRQGEAGGGFFFFFFLVRSGG